MGELAYKTVSLALTSYIENKDSYEQVASFSETLIAMADEAEEKAFELIARFQPVASDLRILKSYMKITYDFERYGRYALDISQVQRRLGGLDACEEWNEKTVVEMSERVLNMVYTTVNSLRSHNIELARSLSETEMTVDDSYFKYIDRLIEKAPATNRCTISSVLVVRYLERIADHAIYIGESIIYLATGEKAKLG
jgi:phosphate transport system protein